MTKYIGWISVVITILGVIIGGSISYGKLEARVEKTSEKIASVEKKVDELDKENDELKDENSKMDKSLGEFSIEQKYVVKKVDEVNEGLKELIREIKKKK